MSSINLILCDKQINTFNFFPQPNLKSLDKDALFWVGIISFNGSGIRNTDINKLHMFNILVNPG